MAKSKAKSKSIVPVASQSSGGVTAKTRKRKQKNAQLLPPYVELMINPFTGPRIGASPPDDVSLATLVWEDVLYTTITPDAQGNFLAQINPFIAGLMSVYTLDTNGVSTTPITVTQSTNYATLATTFQSYRPLATCVEVEYIGKNDDAKGVIGIATGNMGQVTSGSTLVALTDERSYKEVSISSLDSVAAVAKQSHGDFVTISATSEHTGHNVAFIYIGGAGLPTATNCIRVRIKHVGDYIARVSSLLQSQAAYTPHHPPQLATANSIVGPNAETAAGKSPVTTLVAYRRKAAKLAGELNGLIGEARAWGPVVAEFMALAA